MVEYSRPEVQSKKRVLRLEAIPRRNYEMEYRYPLRTTYLKSTFALTTLLSCSLVALPMLIICRLFGYVLLQPAAPLVALGLGVGLDFAFLLHYCQEPASATRPSWKAALFRALCYCLLPSFLWLAIILVSSAIDPVVALVTLLPLAALVGMYFADTLSTHFLYWATANPRNDLQTIRRWRAAWSRRFSPRSELPPTHMPISKDAERLQSASQAAFRWFRLGFLVPPLAFFLTLGFAWFAAQSLAGNLLTTVSLYFFIGIELFVALIALRSSPNAFRALLRALLTFLHARSPRYETEHLQNTLETNQILRRFVPFALLICVLVSPPLAFVAFSTVGAFLFGRHIRELVVRYSTPSPTRPPWVFLSPVGENQLRLILILVFVFFASAATTTIIHPAPRPDFYVAENLVDAYLGFLNQITLRLTLITHILHILAAPLLLSFALAVQLAGPMVSSIYSALESPRAYEHHSDFNDLQGYQRRAAESSNPDESQSFIPGISVYEKIPLLLHRSTRLQHQLFNGPTMAHKSVLAILPQLVHDIAYLHSPLLCVDMKGDRVLLHTVLDTARQTGRVVRILGLSLQDASFVFNLFRQQINTHLMPEQLVDILLQATGLSHGSGYGKSYYMRKSYRHGFDALNYRNHPTLAHRLALIAPHGIQSLADYANILDALVQFDMKTYGDAEELLHTIDSLKRIPQLNLSPASHPGHPALEHAIDVLSAIENREITYLFLRSTTSPILSSQIAKLVLFLYAAAAAHHSRAEPDLIKPIYIDELQCVLSEQFRILLEQGREHGLAFTLCHQDESQLKQAGAELLTSIFENTATKRFFGIESPELRERVSKMSGEVMYATYTWPQSAESIIEGSNPSP